MPAFHTHCPGKDTSPSNRHRHRRPPRPTRYAAIFRLSAENDPAAKDSSIMQFPSARSTAIPLFSGRTLQRGEKCRQTTPPDKLLLPRFAFLLKFSAPCNAFRIRQEVCHAHDRDPSFTKCCDSKEGKTRTDTKAVDLPDNEQHSFCAFSRLYFIHSPLCPKKRVNNNMIIPPRVRHARPGYCNIHDGAVKLLRCENFAEDMCDNNLSQQRDFLSTQRDSVPFEPWHGSYKQI